MDKKQLEESRKFITNLIQNKKIKTSIVGESKFFLEKSHHSIETASRLLELIEEENLNSQMWVINASYYSMFFAVTALLAKKNKKIDSEIGIHKATFHAFIYYFYDKIKENYIENYKEAIEESEELLNFSENSTNNLFDNYNFELNKRRNFTYFMGQIAETSKAKTSLKRAKEFLIKIEEIYEAFN